MKTKPVEEIIFFTTKERRHNEWFKTIIIKVEHYRISKLLSDSSVKHYRISKLLSDSSVSKFVRKKWIELNDLPSS